MIGSGFSRYAKKVRPDVGEIPLWSDLADALSTSLSVSRDDPNRDVNREPERSSHSALDLSQEYRQSFGRARLHQFLIESVNDEDYRPGKLHRRLLKLPWKDVFTTNWDTLLERCLPVPERSYSLVTSPDHLPIIAPPRIIKLHGSFPGAFPLIVTKDDYRNYPSKFAPFVNTVQQAMMESVVLLLGFSGQDPNFRRWLDWVEENLGEAAPRIYLAGWLGLSELRKAELRKKNVVPIDLARHPKASIWPEPQRRSKAMEWVILSLEQGRPYPPEDWPSYQEPNRPSVPADLQPVQSVLVRRPQEELWGEAPGEPHEPAYLEKIREVVRVWRHNRKCYPSWSVMPFGVARILDSYTDHWEPAILTALPYLGNATERLEVLAELVWRREMQLYPLFENLEVAVAGVLKEFDCRLRLVGGEETEDADWRHIRRHWRTLAAALTTTARFDFDRKKFEYWIDQLATFTDEDEDVAERVRHEKCLWVLNQQDYARLEVLLDEWQPRAADPIWLLRKAALFLELGRTEEARKLALLVMESARKWSSHSTSLSGLSCEAWALWLAHSSHEDYESFISRLHEFESRFRELEKYRCNPRAEFRAHKSAVMGNLSEEERKPFDLGMTIDKGWNFSNEATFRAQASLRAIRFIEVVGSPSVASGHLLSLATEALLPFSPEWTAALTVRSAHRSVDRRFSKTLSRWRVAFMPSELARSLAESQRGTVEVALEKSGNDGGTFQTPRIWRHRLEAAIEALSRLFFAWNPRKYKVSWNWHNPYTVISGFARMFSSPNLSQSTAQIVGGSSRFFKGEHALNLLTLPIVGVDGFTAQNEYAFEDAGSIINP